MDSSRIEKNEKRSRWLAESNSFGTSSEKVDPGRRESLGQGGFTLIELFVVFMIIGILVSMVAPTWRTLSKRAQKTRCMAEINGIQFQVEAYFIEYSDWPATLANIGGVTITDPFGNPYQYVNHSTTPALSREVFGSLLNTSYDIFSLGEDGITSIDIMDPESFDDIIRGRDGGFIGIGSDF